MDFVEVNEHIAEWCDENGYRIVESHKLKNRQSAINSERDFRKTQQKISNNIENSLQMIA